MPDPTEDVTELLNRMRDGDAAAADRAMAILYKELRALAGRFMARERADHTLQPTALVNEAFLRLVGQRQIEWRSRAHFLGVAAQAMRRVLVDHARRQAAAKRMSGPVTTVTVAAPSMGERTLDLLVLNDALERLTAVNGRPGRIVELRFFAGLEVEEVAEVLGVSVATVKRDWRFAKAWLGRALSETVS